MRSIPLRKHLNETGVSQRVVGRKPAETTEAS